MLKGREGKIRYNTNMAEILLNYSFIIRNRFILVRVAVGQTFKREKKTLEIFTSLNADDLQPIQQL